MKTALKSLWSFFLLLMLCLFVSFPALAHGGVDDEAPAPLPAAAEPGQVVKTAKSGLFEIVIKYPEAHSDQVPLKIFISDFATNEPINQAQVGLEFQDQNVTAKFVSVGMYSASLRFPKAEEASLIINLTAGKNSDILSVDNLMAPAATPPAKAPAAFPTGQVLSVLGGILVLALVGWGYRRFKIGRRTESEHTSEAAPRHLKQGSLDPLPVGPEDEPPVSEQEPKGHEDEPQGPDHA